MRRSVHILFLLLPLLLASTLRAQPGETRAAVVIAFDDGSVITSCVDLGADGQATGEEVLEDAGVAFTADYSNGSAAVCKIGGIGCDYPTETCFCECTLRPGVPCRYWGYSRLVGDAWRFSALGSGAQTVRGGDVEGWAWGEGSVAQGAVPPVRSFGEICPARAGDPTPGSSPTATASPTASATASATPTPSPIPPVATPLAASATVLPTLSLTPTPSPTPLVATPLAASATVLPTLSLTPQQAAVLPTLSSTPTPSSIPPTPTSVIATPLSPMPSPVATPLAASATSGASPAPLPTPPIATPTPPIVTLTPGAAPPPIAAPLSPTPSVVVATPLATSAVSAALPSPAPTRPAGLPAPAPAPVSSAPPTPDYFGYLFFALLAAGLLLARALILRRQP